MSVQKAKPRSRQAVAADVIAALATRHDDVALRERLEQLASEPAFDGLTSVWGPALYQRNRVLFRPFILAHFSTWAVDGVRWRAVDWEGPESASLENWLALTALDDDPALFSRLYAWKLGSLPQKERAPTWRQRVLAQVRAATDRAGRFAALGRFRMTQLGLELDEATASELYELDAQASRAFILEHLPYRHDRRVFWEELHARAQAAGDNDFADELYRRQVPLARWSRDTLRLADEIADAHELCDALERLHPRGWMTGLGPTFVSLVDRRGRDVLPFVVRHLAEVNRQGWGDRGIYRKLLDRAQRERWIDFWGALVRVCATPKEADAELAALASDRKSSEDEIRARLLAFAGVSRELNLSGLGLARIHQIPDDTALALYERFPDLMRGPLKAHVMSGWNAQHPRLTRRVLDAGDEPFADYLASRIVTRGLEHAPKEVLPIVDLLAEHYERLADDAPEFARRAANVLSQVPAYSIYGFEMLVRTNRLARLFFLRASRLYLADPPSVRELLESPQIHVQVLAFRALSLDDDRARDIAAQNIDLLSATLLRPLFRRTRQLAFGALANATQREDDARFVLSRARDAMDLPDAGYPKQWLVELIGRVLARHPSLRSPREVPVVFRRTA